jgi:hypothetical protein
VTLFSNLAVLYTFHFTVATFGILSLTLSVPRKTLNESHPEVQTSLAVRTFCPWVPATGKIKVIFDALLLHDVICSKIEINIAINEYCKFFIVIYLTVLINFISPEDP